MRSARTLGLWLVFAVGCASGNGATVFTLPDVVNEPGADTASVGFGDSGAGSDSTGVTDVGISDVPVDTVDLSDSVSTDGAGTDASGDATATPDVPATITSCFGHCGLVLETNPCHCGPTCKADGNCCSDYEVSCKCQSDAACDDGNPCTDDTCASGYCKQFPIFGKTCCNTDAQCSGGDACNVAKCLEGTCSLQATNCNDGLACTNDVCDPNTGACSNKLVAGQCFIDGACHKAGDYDPNSAGCASCDPLQSSTGWSPKPGMCIIDGGCYKSGDVNPMSSCAVCDTTKSTTAWTGKSGTCFIDGQCYNAKASNPQNSACELCDPAASSKAWSPVAGKCNIGGVCYDSGAVDPSAPDCRSCDPTKNKSDFTLKAGSCFIGGSCYTAGAVQAGSNSCGACDATKATTAWTFKPAGSACDDGSLCTTGEKCDGTGLCKGSPIANCCMADADCANYKFKAGEEPGPCDKVVCLKGAGICDKQAIALCCVSGVCCDVGAKSVMPINTVCNNSMKVGVQYQCNGQAVEQRPLYYGCTGASPSKCSSDTPGYGDWSPTGKVCDPSQNCVLVSPDVTPNCVNK